MKYAQARRTVISGGSFDVDFEMAVPPKGTQQALKDQFKRTAGAFWADTSVVIEGADSWKFHAEFDTVEKCGSFAKRIAQIMGKPLRQWLRPNVADVKR